jgi:glucans biosynthesis protein C
MTAAVASSRRCDIDWLRVGAICVVFLFHCAQPFNRGWYHVKNGQTSFAFTVVSTVVLQWMMPLFFILSAMATYHALGRRSDRQYLAERANRLLVPLVFGMFILSPPQVYIERVNHGEFAGSFVEFLPHSFHGFYRLGGNFAWMGLHLWYLEMLFLFSLVTLPLFRRLRSAETDCRLTHAVGAFARPWAIYLLAVPVALAQILANLQPTGVGIRDFGGWSPIAYMVFFLLGYMLATDDRYRVCIEHQRIVALVLGCLTTIGGYVMEAIAHVSEWSPVLAVLVGFNAWFWLVAILGFGSRHLDARSRALIHANEAVMPFYVLHQPVIVIVAYYIVAWDAGIAAKFTVLAAVSLFIILALYEGLVRRLRPLRFLFGMRSA